MTVDAANARGALSGWGPGEAGSTPAAATDTTFATVLKHLYPDDGRSLDFSALDPFSAATHPAKWRKYRRDRRRLHRTNPRKYRDPAPLLRLINKKHDWSVIDTAHTWPPA